MDNFMGDIRRAGDMTIKAEPDAKSDYTDEYNRKHPNDPVPESYTGGQDFDNQTEPFDPLLSHNRLVEQINQLTDKVEEQQAVIERLVRKTSLK